jgi:hypothetical protein
LIKATRKEFGMPRFVRGVTLTAQERVMVGIGTEGTSSGRATRNYTGTVTLPDGSTCQVTYYRYSRMYHRFAFGAPVSQTLYTGISLDGDTTGIEAEAKAQGVKAFGLAIQEEQKLMRRRSWPKDAVKVVATGETALETKTATKHAGMYAVCVRFTSGRLMRLGTPHKKPEEAIDEIKGGAFDHTALVAGQAIVVGICNRLGRCWQEPRFLTERPQIASSPHRNEPEVEPSIEVEPPSEPVVEQSTRPARARKVGTKTQGRKEHKTTTPPAGRQPRPARPKAVKDEPKEA